MSLLEYRIHMVRCDKWWRYKVLAYCTNVIIFEIVSIDVVIWKGTWIQLHDSIDSYSTTGLGWCVDPNIMISLCSVPMSKNA
jgi:hypothetical protein